MPGTSAGSPRRDAHNLLPVEEGAPLSPFQQRFFCLTSESCTDATSRLYGWRLANGEIQADCALAPGEGRLASGDAQGAHVRLLRTGDTLTVETDRAGNALLWLFRKEDFWAVSNSFYLLVRTLRQNTGMGLSLDEEYAAHLLLLYNSPFMEARSLCREIALLPATATLHIDLAGRTLQTVERAPTEKVSLLSEDGVALVDRWIDTWSGLLRGVCQARIPLHVDVTGGFDSRVALALLLASGVRLDDIGFIASGHAQSQDMKIAEKLAKTAGFPLNAQPRSMRGGPPLYLRTRPEDAFLCHAHTLRALDTGSMMASCFSPRIRLRMGGYSGEVHRAAWALSPDGFIRKHLTHKFGEHLRNTAIRAFLGAWRGVEATMPGSAGGDEREVLVRLYARSRRRLHFGSAANENALGNVFLLQPLADPLLGRLHQHEAPNRDTLFAFIMERIGARIKNIPYENGKSFLPGSVEAARTLNADFPRRRGARDSHPVSMRARPLEFEEYSGSMGLNQVLKQELLGKLPRFANSFPRLIADYARTAENCLHGNVPHIAPIADFL